MNLSSRFYVKSSYIRAAKDHWVLCDVRLLTDDVDTFLCIKSLPPSTNQEEDESKEPEVERRGKWTTEKKTKGTSFTALCNLSEYKSCSVRTVTVNDRDSFAIRLVPAGVIGNKQLLIASVDENEITTWLAICKASIGKKGRNSQQRDNMSTMGTLSKAGSFMSLKPMNNSIDAECDDGLLDNEVYEAYSSEDKIPALLEEAGDWIKLHLNQPECYLRLTEERLEVLDAITEKPVQWFPYLLIRRFGAANGVLRVDAGRRCSSGDGRFFFRCSPPNGQPVDMLVTQIRQLALEAKQRLRRTQLTTSEHELNGQHTIRRTTALTPDGFTNHTSTSATELDNDTHCPGTMPRARPKRQKQSSETPLDQVHKGNGFLPNGSTPVQSESTSDTSKLSPETNFTSSSQEDGEIVKAVPGRARKQDQTENTNVYDNIPRPPRKGINLPGAVNVLPLPARARHKSHSNNRESSTETGIKVDSSNNKEPGRTPSPILRSSSVSTPRNGIPHIDADDDPPSGPPPPPPHAGEFGRKTVDTTPSLQNLSAKGTVVRTTKPNFNHPVPPSIPTTSGTSSTSINSMSQHTTGNGSTAVMRVPPFTSPKSNVAQVPGVLKLHTESANSPSETRFVASEQNPVPLSKVLDTKISSASMYLKGPHPSMKKEPIHCSQLNFTPTQGVSTMINRLNAEWKAPRVAPRKQELSTSNMSASLTEESAMDDPKNYLNELDSVIKELCQANEEAVKATREAARRRHQVGWPVPYRPPHTEDKNSISEVSKVTP